MSKLNGENASNPLFLLFPQSYNHVETDIIILSTLNLSSANAYSLGFGRLTFSQTSLLFTCLQYKTFENNVGRNYL